MKHKMLFVLLLSSMVYTPISAQKVTINLQQVKLEKVFSAVTKQTGLTVAYSRPTVNPDMIVSVRADNEELPGVLSRLFAGTNVTFEIGKKIYLKEKTADVTKSINQIHQNISGKITDNKGEPIIGASILVKETTKGTISDLNGNFTIDAAPDQTLIVSYIGYKSQELPVLDKKFFKIKLLDNTEVLDEVVVTALGIKRSEKALSYNVQQVNADAVTTNKDANFINSLSGKVAGVNINASSSEAGGMSKVVMRGTKSIMQSSNALYVIDGVPMFSNTSKVNGTEFTSQGNSEPIADINPEDIESMSVLTGAAAAALYGSDAANGAIIITTKKGKKGKISITVNSNVEFNSPFVLPRFQSRYGSGIGGVLDNGSSRSWGPKMTIANYQGYNPKDDYFQTGVIGTENISFSTGNDKNQTYASAAAVNSKGIIPNNKYDRYNFTVRNTTSFLKDKMTLDMTGSYILQEDRNMVNQGTYNNPLVGAYLFPRGNDWNDIKIYEEYDNARKIYTQKWPTGDGNMTMQNPYWVNYRNLRENRKDRYILGASLDYQVLDWLKLSGRVRLDNASNDYTEKACKYKHPAYRTFRSRSLRSFQKL